MRNYFIGKLLRLVWNAVDITDTSLGKQSYFSQNWRNWYLTGVLEEAEFYNVADLVALVQQRIADRDAKKNQVCC